MQGKKGYCIIRGFSEKYGVKEEELARQRQEVLKMVHVSPLQFRCTRQKRNI